MVADGALEIFIQYAIGFRISRIYISATQRLISTYDNRRNRF